MQLFETMHILRGRQPQFERRKYFKVQRELSLIIVLDSIILECFHSARYPETYPNAILYFNDHAQEI
jgi:hypothetical protein